MSYNCENCGEPTRFQATGHYENGEWVCKPAKEKSERTGVETPEVVERALIAAEVIKDFSEICSSDIVAIATQHVTALARIKVLEDTLKIAHRGNERAGQRLHARGKHIANLNQQIAELQKDTKADD